MNWCKIKSMWHISMSSDTMWHANMLHDRQRDKIHFLMILFSSLVIANEIIEEKTI